MVLLKWERRYLFEILIAVLLDNYPEVELLNHMVVLFLIFRGTSILFSIVAVPIYIPMNSIQGFPFFYILVTLVIFCLFDNSCSNQCEVLSHCRFDLYFSDG